MLVSHGVDVSSWQMKTYSVSEVCEMISCDSERWLITRVRKGIFPARKINRHIVFTEDDVKAILDACLFKPEASLKVKDVFMPELSSRSRRAG